MCPALPAPTDGAILGCPGNASVNYDTVCQFLCKVLKREDVNTMEPGVDESLFVKVSSSIFTFR